MFIATLSLGAAMPADQPPAIAKEGPTIKSFAPAGHEILEQHKADFNGDGVLDAVLVIQRRGETDPEASRPLLVLFGTDRGGFRLAARADEAIPSPSSGGVADQDGFAGLKVRGNTFFIKRYGGSTIREEDSYQFRYQAGGWYLIGETHDISTVADFKVPDCPLISAAQKAHCVGYKVDTNLSTRQQIVSVYLDDSDQGVVSRRSVEIQRPVRLETFSPDWTVPVPR
jgi:hypothetical protein